jgi:hypothetical protein
MSLVISLAFSYACSSEKPPADDGGVDVSVREDELVEAPVEHRKYRDTPACFGYGILSLKGPINPGEGFGFFTLEYAGKESCIRELSINGEPAEREPKPCEKYRLQVGQYTAEYKDTVYKIEHTSRFAIKKDQRTRFPFMLVRCDPFPCGRTHDCPELDEEMRRLWEATKDERERLEKESRKQGWLDRAKRKRECADK